MKYECSSEKFQNAIRTAVRCTGKNVSLPILGSILCIARNNEVVIRATNLNLGYEATIPAKVSSEGVCALPADILLSVCDAIKKETNLSFELKDTQCKITHSTGVIELATIAYEDFPTLPDIEDGVSVSFDATDLTSLFKSVLMSASHTDIKPELASLYLTVENGVGVSCATDTFRLAEKRISMKKTNDFNPILIPAKNALEIIRILESVTGPIACVFAKNQCSFTHPLFYLTSRVIDGVFPDYKQIIPKQFETTITLLKNDLLGALKTVSYFTDSFYQVTLNCTATSVTVAGVGNQYGTSTQTLTSVLEGFPVKLTLNGRYMLDAFTTIGTDSIVIGCNGPTKPIVVRGVGDTTFTYLVMPNR